MNGLVHRRAERLKHLYKLQRQVAAEIAGIEAEVTNEVEAIKRARAEAQAAGVKAPNKRAALCGTDSGYYRHLRGTKTPPCDACKLAHRTAEALRQKARKGAA